jgi:hypothetical protein
MDTTKLSFEVADAAGAGEIDEKVAVLVAHEVGKQTEKSAARISELEAALATEKAARTTAENALDVANAATKTATEAFESFKVELAEKAALAERSDARRAAVAEKAPSLLEGEAAEVDAKVARWASMEDADFASYLNDLAAVSTPAKKVEDKPFQGKTTDTAMRRGSASTSGTASAGRKFLIG